LLIGAGVVVLDRVTKAAVLAEVGQGGDPVTVVRDFFWIVCHRNSGAAFGVFQNGRPFFLALTPIVLAALAYLFWRFRWPFARVGFSLVFGGAVGNFIDRVAVGSVVDFLQFKLFGSYFFPTFNVADSAIVCGAALLLCYFLFVDRDALAWGGPAHGAGKGGGAP
jgi:signal peptidase II